MKYLTIKSTTKQIHYGSLPTQDILLFYDLYVPGSFEPCEKVETMTSGRQSPHSSSTMVFIGPDELS